MSRASDELEHAEKFARELSIEKHITRQQRPVPLDMIARADHSFALRQLIYHCTAAVVAAIEDRGS